MDQGIAAIGCTTIMVMAICIGAAYFIPGQYLLAMARVGASFLIFGTACGAVVALWKIVFDSLTDRPTGYAKALVELVGGFNAEGTRADGTKFRLTGVGMLGTIFIVLCSIAVIYIIMFAPAPVVAPVTQPSPAT